MREVTPFVLVFIVAATAACHATTAYNADHTKSWACLEQKKPQAQPTSDTPLELALYGKRPFLTVKEGEEAKLAEKK